MKSVNKGGYYVFWRMMLLFYEIEVKVYGYFKIKLLIVRWSWVLLNE